MTHQVDMGKFVAREGELSQGMGRQLEILGRPEMKMLLQTFAWSFHEKGLRAGLLPERDDDRFQFSSDGLDMLSCLLEVVNSGRFSLFESIKRADSENEVQFVHLSFQEVLSADYASA